MAFNLIDLPLELKMMIIRELDIISRFKFSACSKSAQELVQKTKFNAAEITISPFEFRMNYDNGHIICVKNAKGPSAVKIDRNGVETIGFGQIEEIVTRIMSLCNLRFPSTSLYLNLSESDDELTRWFCDNFNINPSNVDITVGLYDEDYYGSIDPFLNWHSGTKLTIDADSGFSGDIFESSKVYENIVELRLTDYLGMDDEKLLTTIPNATNIYLEECLITGIGVGEWLKREDYKIEQFLVFFGMYDPITFDDIQEVIEPFIRADTNDGTYRKIQVRKNANETVTIHINDDEFILCNDKFLPI